MLSSRIPLFFEHVHYVVFVSFLLNTPLVRRLIKAERGVLGACNPIYDFDLS